MRKSDTKGVYVRPEVHAELKRRAEASGRSIAKEIELAVLGKIITPPQGRPFKAVDTDNGGE